MISLETRIRLEGQVELVEQQIAGLQVATRGLKSSFPCGLDRARRSSEQERAERAVRRARDPSLDSLLRQLDGARDVFYRQLEARLTLLRLGGLTPLSAAVRAIEAEPLRFCRRVVSHQLWAGLGLAAVGSGVILHLGEAWLAPLFGLLGLGMSLVCTLPFPVKVVLTPRRLIMGRACFALSDVEFIRVSNQMMNRTPFPVSLELFLREGGRVELSMPGFPQTLRSELQRLGVRLEDGRLWM